MIKNFIHERKLDLRVMTWDKVKVFLQKHLAEAPAGEASRIARELGITSSQVHRMACPKCEHNQEPLFTIGFSLLAYLCQYRFQPELIEIKPSDKLKEPKALIFEKAKARKNRNAYKNSGRKKGPQDQSWRKRKGNYVCI